MDRFFFSTDFSLVQSADFQGQIVHLVCLAPEAGFVYNRKYFQLEANDIIVVTRPDLVTDIQIGPDFKCEYVVASALYLNSLMPMNNYGVGGGISLFDNPLMRVTAAEAAHFREDILRIRDRSAETGHLFHEELMASLAQTMIYDLYDFHARLNGMAQVGEQAVGLMRKLIGMLEAGESRTHRSVNYYADKLHVSPKYLSELVKKTTGFPATHFIDRYTLPIIMDYLKNSELSLSQIADEMEFASLSYFTRYVGRHLGVSPSEFRRGLLPGSGV